MSAAAVERLRAVVAGDEALERRLLAIDDPEDFLAAVLALAAEHALDLRREDLELARREGQRAWLERWL